MKQFSVLLCCSVQCEQKVSLRHRLRVCSCLLFSLNSSISVALIWTQFDNSWGAYSWSRYFQIQHECLDVSIRKVTVTVECNVADHTRFGFASQTPGHILTPRVRCWVSHGPKAHNSQLLLGIEGIGSVLEWYRGRFTQCVQSTLKLYTGVVVQFKKPNY